MPADKMSKKIKFALTLKDGEEVRTMKELKEQLEKNFDGSIIKCFWDGENKSKLAQWLEDHYYYDEAEKINELWNEYDEQEKNSKDLDKFAYDLIEKIFSIFKLPPPEAEIVQKIDLNQIEKNSDKEDELDDKIANENVKKYLNKYINQVARNQAEFDKIVAQYLNKTNNKKVSVYILRDDDHRYIFKSQYLTETNITFVGINNDNDDEIEIEIQKNVDGKNVRWTREEYENFFNKKNNHDRLNNFSVWVTLIKKSFIGENEEEPENLPTKRLVLSGGGLLKKILMIALKLFKIDCFDIWTRVFH